MKRLQPGAAMALGALLSAFFLFLVLAIDCTPGQREAAAVVVPALGRAACVVLHALAKDGTIDSICATADELAPVVRTLLESREARESEPVPLDDADEAKPSRLSFAVALQPVAELPTPKRAVARRHCALWVPVASSTDGGRTTHARDGQAEGSPDADR